MAIKVSKSKAPGGQHRKENNQSTCTTMKKIQEKQKFLLKRKLPPFAAIEVPEI